MADDAPLKISREDLYELAWSKPMSDLAKDFGISDVGLAKRCRRLGIPVPGRGYWARLDAGQSPHRPSLPAREPEWGDGDALTIQPLTADAGSLSGDPEAPADVQAISEQFERREPADLEADALWLKERLAFEAALGNKIELEAPGRRWHPVAKTYRDAYETAAKEMRASKKAYEQYEAWPETRKRVSNCPREAWNWQWVRNRGQRLKETHKASACRVSLGTFDRAMKILNVLAVEAGKRGFEVEDDTQLGRIAFVGRDARILLRIAEPLLEQERTKVGYKGQKEVESFSVPTGRLRITVGIQFRDAATFEDRDEAPLDESLNKVFAAFYRLIVKERTTNRRDHFKDLLREAEYRKRVEFQRLVEEDQARAAEEQRRRRGLLREARRWEDAQRIRQYVEHIKARGVSQNDQVHQSWMSWALSVAAEIDPSDQRA